MAERKKRADRPIDRRAAGRLALAGGAALLLAACGKKGPPQAPPGDPAPYPRTYPQGATPNPNSDPDSAL
ncbi:MAG: hypothetical protein RIB45_03080 [Marivibrio sp.]|uniref:hypothetical protein n=1 Tax=Marivibrio sp. TaxID=2039719 RepID=UPI0032EF8BED